MIHIINARQTWPILIGLVLSLLPRQASTHPISMSAAAVNVQADKIMANLRIMLEDLVMYHHLQADADGRFTYDDLKRAAHQHQSFIRRDFTLRNAQGHQIPGKILRLDLSQLPAEGVPQSALMARHVYYHMAFPLDQRQAFITFMQRFGGEDAVLPAIMELLVFQNRVMLHRPVQLQQGKPHTIRFDWDHPPPKSAPHWNDDPLRQQKEFEQRLGITSYSGLYSFIYMTDQEVRHEILIPLLSLEKWLPLKRAHTDFIDVPEQDAARDTLSAFFSKHAPVMIDGMKVKPIMQRLQFFGLDINDFARHAAPRRVSVYQARLGIILSYATKGAPRHVQVPWTLFNDHAPFLRSVVYAYDRDPMIHVFQKGRADFRWTRTHDAVQPALLDVPAPALPPRWALPLLSLTAWCGAALWAATAWWRQALRLRMLPGMFVLLVVGAVCWPMARLEVRSLFAPAPKVTAIEARELVFSLLRNIYRAFDYQSEDDVYEALAQSVEGQRLEKLYLQIQRGLQMREQGGALAQVKDVQLVDHQLIASQTTSAGLPQFRVQCRWRVVGTVEHWGHLHTRENQYEALFTVSAQPNDWKITDYDVLEEQRVRSETGIRTAKRSGEVQPQGSGWHQ